MYVFSKELDLISSTLQVEQGSNRLFLQLHQSGKQTWWNTQCSFKSRTQLVSRPVRTWTITRIPLCRLELWRLRHLCFGYLFHDAGCFGELSDVLRCERPRLGDCIFKRRLDRLFWTLWNQVDALPVKEKDHMDNKIPEDGESDRDICKYVRQPFHTTTEHMRKQRSWKKRNGNHLPWRFNLNGGSCDRPERNQQEVSTLQPLNTYKVSTTCVHHRVCINSVLQPA